MGEGSPPRQLLQESNGKVMIADPKGGPQREKWMNFRDI